MRPPWLQGCLLLAVVFSASHNSADAQTGLICPNKNPLDALTAAGAVEHFMGTGVLGHADGFRTTEATLYLPWGIAVAPDNSAVYIADGTSNNIRMVNLSTGQATRLAGGTWGVNTAVGGGGYLDAVGSNARFSDPRGLAVSKDGHTLYVADSAGHRIRAIDIATQNVTTFVGSGANNGNTADAVGTLAHMQNPQAIVMSPDGRTLFVTQVLARKIRQIDIASRKVTVLMDHEMYFAMAISPDGKKLLLTSSSSLSMVDIANKTSTIIAGGGAGYSDGAGTDATFTSAFGLAFDPTGNSSWALVGDGKTVRMVDLASESKTVTTIAGSLTAPKGDAVGRGDEMRINTVYGMAVSPDGLTVYISDHNNRKIKTISLCPNKCGAVCGANYYASVPSNCTANTFPTCSTCPVGSATSQGATSLADCVVQVQVAQANEVVDSIGGLVQVAQANEVVDSIGGLLDSVVSTVIECGPGSFLTKTGCLGCPLGTFKDGTSSSTSCLPCGINQTTLGNTTASAGHDFSYSARDTEGMHTVGCLCLCLGPCARLTAEIDDLMLAAALPLTPVSVVYYDRIAGCVCATGFFRLDNGTCDECPAGFFCPPSGSLSRPLECPKNSRSQPLSTKIDQCRCLPFHRKSEFEDGSHSFVCSQNDMHQEVAAARDAGRVMSEVAAVSVALGVVAAVTGAVGNAVNGALAGGPGVLGGGGAAGGSMALTLVPMLQNMNVIGNVGRQPDDSRERPIQEFSRSFKWAKYDFDLSFSIGDGLQEGDKCDASLLDDLLHRFITCTVILLVVFLGREFCRLLLKHVARVKEISDDLAFPMWEAPTALTMYFALSDALAFALSTQCLELAAVYGTFTMLGPILLLLLLYWRAKRCIKKKDLEFEEQDKITYAQMKERHEAAQGHTQKLRVVVGWLINRRSVGEWDTSNLTRRKYSVVLGDMRGKTWYYFVWLLGEQVLILIVTNASTGKINGAFSIAIYSIRLILLLALAPFNDHVENVSQIISAVTIVGAAILASFPAFVGNIDLVPEWARGTGVIVMTAFGTAVACVRVFLGPALDLVRRFMSWMLFIKEQIGVQSLIQRDGMAGLTVHAVAEGGAVVKGTAQGLIADEARDSMTQKVVGEKNMTGGTMDDSEVEEEGKNVVGEGACYVSPLGSNRDLPPLSPLGSNRDLPPLGSNRDLPPLGRIRVLPPLGNNRVLPLCEGQD